MTERSQFRGRLCGMLGLRETKRTQRRRVSQRRQDAAESGQEDGVGGVAAHYGTDEMTERTQFSAVTPRQNEPNVGGQAARWRLKISEWTLPISGYTRGQGRDCTHPVESA